MNQAERVSQTHPTLEEEEWRIRAKYARYKTFDRFDILPLLDTIDMLRDFILTGPESNPLEVIPESYIPEVTGGNGTAGQIGAPPTPYRNTIGNPE